MHYVLGLWSRMVAAVPYVRVDTTADPMLDAFVPKVWLTVAQYRLAFLMAAHSLDNSSQCEPGRGGGGPFLTSRSVVASDDARMLRVSGYGCPSFFSPYT